MCLNDGHLNKASEQEVTAPSPNTKVNTYVKTNVFTNVPTYVKKNVNTNGNLIKISPFISLIVLSLVKGSNATPFKTRSGDLLT